MEEIELELTYLAKEIPKDLDKFESKKIIDIYFPKNDSNRKLRLRQNGFKFELTKKSPINKNDFSIQTEHTIELTQKEFIEFLKIEGLKVEKQRYNYKHNDAVVEIDIFEGNLKGLVLIDFEFNSEEEKNNFTMPDFCLVDVTQEFFISGGALAGKNFDEIKADLKKFNYKKLN